MAVIALAADKLVKAGPSRSVSPWPSARANRVARRYRAVATNLRPSRSRTSASCPAAPRFVLVKHADGFASRPAAYTSHRCAALQLLQNRIVYRQEVARVAFKVCDLFILGQPSSFHSILYRMAVYKPKRPGNANRGFIYLVVGHVTRHFRVELALSIRLHPRAPGSRS